MGFGIVGILAEFSRHHTTRQKLRVMERKRRKIKLPTCFTFLADFWIYFNFLTYLEYRENSDLHLCKGTLYSPWTKFDDIWTLLVSSIVLEQIMIVFNNYGRDSKPRIRAFDSATFCLYTLLVLKERIYQITAFWDVVNFGKIKIILSIIQNLILWFSYITHMST